MILTAHQPTYLPWLGTFNKILLSDCFCFFDIAQYQKKEWDNRNKIFTSKGELMLTVPVKSKNHFEKTIGNIEINNETNWAEKHYKSIHLNYKKHPFYENHRTFLEHMYLHKTWHRLADLNIHFYNYILKALNYESPILMASDYNFRGKKSDLILDMCKTLEASTYIFGGEGENYANKLSFKNANIELIFQEYNHPEYIQFRNKGNFASHLSILDLIMNYDNHELKGVILNKN